MSAQNTPGPWVAVKYSAKRLGLGQAGDSAFFMLHVVDDEADAEWARANARLIAAAPELLAHLKIVAFHLRRGDFERRSSLSDEALDHIEKTIAKATGSTS